MIIETIQLNRVINITLLDQTGHYFGGYYHVKVLAYCDIPLEPHYFESDAEYGDAINKLGSSVRFERVLEKMAIPESDIDVVRCQLIQTFRETANKYLSMPDLAHRFVRSEYLKCINKSSPVRIPRA